MSFKFLKSESRDTPKLATIALAQAATVWNPGDLLHKTGGYWVRCTSSADYADPIAVASGYKTTADPLGYYPVFIPQFGDIWEADLDAKAEVHYGAKVEIVDHLTVTPGSSTPVGACVAADQYQTTPPANVIIAKDKIQMSFVGTLLGDTIYGR